MQLTHKELIPGQLAAEETLFHVANGYLGVRGCFEEGYPDGVPSVRGCYINGFYDDIELSYPERLYGFPERAQRIVNLPDVQTVLLWLDDERFDPFAGELLAFERTLDAEKGVYTRRVRWRSPRGKTVEIEIARMASFTRPELFYTQYRVESVDFQGEARFECAVDCDVTNFHDPDDPRVASGPQQHIFFDSAQVSADKATALCHTGVSGLSLAVCQKLKLEGGDVRYRSEKAGFSACASIRLSPGQAACLERHIVFSDSRRQASPLGRADAVAEECWSAGGAALLEEQRAWLERFWQVSRVEIDGCPEEDVGIAFSLYQLLQSAGKDSIGNVSAKGLSGEGYEGHYFWDTEIYILPFFLFTQPEIARQLLNFRYSMLDSARIHARLMGHSRGALYPWRTITGSECSSFFPAGSAQYHISGDVAHSFTQYWYATGDEAYMAGKGLEVLLETARLWIDAGHFDRQGRFCIACVTGPDEYTCMINNNYYTNQAARHNLLGAAAVYRALAAKGLHRQAAEKIGFDEAELAGFEQAAEAMYLPYDEKLGINAQDDSFLDKPRWDFKLAPLNHSPLLMRYHPLYLYRHQICKQADTVLSHYLFDEGVDESTMRNSFDYYEELTTHDSSLSCSAFSIMAARLGLVEKAYTYYQHTSRIDLDNTHGNTRDGLHAANLGGAWLALIAGFAGLRLRKNGLHFRFTLPERWDGYRFKVWYKESLIAVSVRRDAVTVELERGEAVTVHVDGKPLYIPSAVRLEGIAK